LYEVKGVDNLGRESVARSLRVQPLQYSLLLNPDETGEEFDSVARHFDRYQLAFDNAAGDEAVAIRSLAVTRQLANGSSFMDTLAVSIDAPAAGDALGEVVVPAPSDHGYAQTVSLVASTAPGVGGEVVSYKLARSLPAATN